jgi:hypothetical protein
MHSYSTGTTRESGPSAVSFHIRKTFILVDYISFHKGEKSAKSVHLIAVALISYEYAFKSHEIFL